MVISEDERSEAQRPAEKRGTGTVSLASKKPLS
jgi:hypothetical protein